MPCNERRRISVDLGKVTQEQVLAAARVLDPNAHLTGQGNVEFNWDRATFIVVDGKVSGWSKVQECASALKVAVAKQAMAAAARRFGWAVQPGAQVNQFLLTR